ncbi:tetratricopeptide repeat protein [Nakamurella deserti]|uniref:tetratricopeptide repeat protein n=1 Tax=Nakamurella deserti TaxID=2164074 RepID=UPI000DBEA751|nr:tetratricopeptide repeat protein [Nakamurella deserti]
MTRSNPRSDPAALSAAFSRAVDLSALKRPAGPAGPAAGAPRPAWVADVTEANFPAEVVEKSAQNLVLVDLGSPRSPVSADVSAMMERVVAPYGGAVALARVDVDAQPRIAQAFGVQTIPTVIAVAAGQPVDAFTGEQPEAQVSTWVQSLVEAVADRLPGMAAAGAVDGAAAEAPVDPLLEQAEDALEAGDLASAITAYEALVAQNPADTEAAAALAQLRFQERAAALPADAVEQAQAAPDDLAAQFDAADLLFATGRTEESFALLVDVVSRFYGDERTATRDHLLELFALVGNDDPLVIASRRKLAAALY